MHYEIKFTLEAEHTFDALSFQLFQRWGERYVKRFESKVSKALDTLGKAPFLYPIVVEETRIRKCIVHRNCSILYLIKEKIVTIICFWDNRQEVLF